MTRVLVFTIEGRIGGAEKIALALASRLPRGEYSPLLLTVRPPGRLHRAAADAGVPAFSLGIARKSDCILFLVRFLRFLRRERPDLIQAFLFYANLSGRLFGRLAGVPVVVCGQVSTDPWRRPFHDIIDRLTAPLASAIICDSRASARVLAERVGIPPARLRLVPSGIEPARPLPRDLARVTIGFPGREILIGAAGNLRPAKGYHVLLRAFRDVQSAFPGARLLVAGEGELRPELEALAGRLGISRSVTWLGFVDDLSAFYSALDIFVLSSLWEGMGLVVPEAMSHGLPVVATRVSGLPEVVEDGREGFLVESGDASSLALSLCRLAGDRDLRRRMGGAGRRKAASFGVERMVQGYARVYRQLAGAEPCPDCRSPLSTADDRLSG